MIDNPQNDKARKRTQCRKLHTDLYTAATHFLIYVIQCKTTAEQYYRKQYQPVIHIPHHPVLLQYTEFFVLAQWKNSMKILKKVCF